MHTIQMPADSVTGQPNCGLVSMAIGANSSVEHAMAAYNRAYWDLYGRYKRGNWKGRTNSLVRQRALSMYMGVAMTGVKSQNAPLYKVVESDLPIGRRYIVQTTGHVQILERGSNGEYYVADQTGVHKMSEYWGRRKRIKNVIRII